MSDTTLEARCIVCARVTRKRETYCPRCRRRIKVRGTAAYYPRCWTPPEERVANSLAGHAPDACCPWLFGINQSGYGTVYVKGKKRLAHRFSYELVHGPIPTGLSILHNCDNPICINPNHLRVGTMVENMRDMAVRLRCGGTKLTIEQVVKIRTCGLPIEQLVELYPMITKSAIYRILGRRTWKYVA